VIPAILQQPSKIISLTVKQAAFLIFKKRVFCVLIAIHYIQSGSKVLNKSICKKTPHFSQVMVVSK